MELYLVRLRRLSSVMLVAYCRWWVIKKHIKGTTSSGMTFIPSIIEICQKVQNLFGETHARTRPNISWCKCFTRLSPEDGVRMFLRNAGICLLPTSPHGVATRKMNIDNLISSPGHYFCVDVVQCNKRRWSPLAAYAVRSGRCARAVTCVNPLLSVCRLYWRWHWMCPGQWLDLHSTSSSRSCYGRVNQWIPAAHLYP
jgi:hypothetical protein